MNTKNSKTNKQINNPKHKNEPKIEVKRFKRIRLIFFMLV